MSERTLQSYFIKEVKKRALGIAVKVDCSSRRGWPDLVLVHKGGEPKLIEMKTASGKLSFHQVEVHEMLSSFGTSVVVLSGIDEVEKFLLGLEYYANA